jgi:hypothetical protein
VVGRDETFIRKSQEDDVADLVVAVFFSRLSCGQEKEGQWDEEDVHGRGVFVAWLRGLLYYYYYVAENPFNTSYFDPFFLYPLFGPADRQHERSMARRFSSLMWPPLGCSG